MTSLEVDDSVNLGHMGDGILEEDQVHLDELGLHIVFFKHVIEVCSELLEVLYFNIWCSCICSNLLLQEININGIFSFGGAMF